MLANNTNKRLTKLCLETLPKEKRYGNMNPNTQLVYVCVYV